MLESGSNLSKLAYHLEPPPLQNWLLNVSPSDPFALSHSLPPVCRHKVKSEKLPNPPEPFVVRKLDESFRRSRARRVLESINQLSMETKKEREVIETRKVNFHKFEFRRFAFIARYEIYDNRREHSSSYRWRPQSASFHRTKTDNHWIN